MNQILITISIVTLGTTNLPNPDPFLDPGQPPASPVQATTRLKTNQWIMQLPPRAERIANAQQAITSTNAIQLTAGVPFQIVTPEVTITIAQPSQP